MRFVEFINDHCNDLFNFRWLNFSTFDNLECNWKRNYFGVRVQFKILFRIDYQDGYDEFYNHFLLYNGNCTDQVYNDSVRVNLWKQVVNNHYQIDYKNYFNR